MKVLIGMPAKDSWGGPASSEPPFAESLRRLATNVREETYVYGDKEKPTPFFERVGRVLKTAFRFRNILSRENFDIIHLNTAFDRKTLLRDTVSLFFMNPKNSKIFLKIHGSEADVLADKNFLFSLLKKYLNKKVAGFGVHTEEEKQNFLRAGFDENKFYFVKNVVAINNDDFLNSQRINKDANEVFRLLFVSRFIPAKGLLETIRACAILRDKNYKFVLNCIGDGEIMKEAVDSTKKSGLEEQIKFTGYIPENSVKNYFFDSDIFVFPTRHAEGFPNVLFKAVAAGMPVVTTKIRAANDYLREPENCLFCTQKPENIAEKVIELIKNKSLRETMCEENIQFGKTLLPENIGREFLEIYNQILQSS